MKIKGYEKCDKELWDDFLDTAKNPIFMFKRDYMEYHSDRFYDNSLLFFEEDKLITIIPLNKSGNVLYSHGGLTFGGFITDAGMKQHRMNDVFGCLMDYMKEKGFVSIIYKEIPHIYHILPAEEDEYSIFWKGAKIIKMEPTSVVDLQKRIKLPKGRKAQISRAKREGVKVIESEDYDTYIKLENDVLKKYHGSKAAHTGKELQLLHERFPDNIKLYAGMYEGEMIAGAVVYIYQNVVKTQYLAANDEARRIGALDYVIIEMMENYVATKKWVDFGKSTEGNGSILNGGLIAQKEGFGGRTVIYKTWQLDVDKRYERY